MRRDGLAMSRSVPEWQTDNHDAAIPPRVKARIIDAQGGKCATCSRKLGAAGESIDFDHRIALANGGGHREANLQALCGMCHVAKTRDDMAVKKKIASVRKKYLGLDRPKRKIPGRRFNGEPIFPKRN